LELPAQLAHRVLDPLIQTQGKLFRPDGRFKPKVKMLAALSTAE